MLFTVSHKFTEHLERRILSSAFFWNEIENEFKERGFDWTFIGNDEDAIQTTLDRLNKQRQGELYRHDCCSPQCKEKGSQPLGLNL